MAAVSVHKGGVHEMQGACREQASCCADLENHIERAVAVWPAWFNKSNMVRILSFGRKSIARFSGVPGARSATAKPCPCGISADIAWRAAFRAPRTKTGVRRPIRAGSWAF